MDLRNSHDRSRGFDRFLIFVALVGIAAIWFGISQGGAWFILAALALMGEALLVYGIFIEPQRLIVTTHRIPLTRDPSVWIRVIFLTDLHAGAFHPPAWYARIANEAMALRPDIVILGGDYVVDLWEPVADLKSLANIPARYGKYFVLGNHDLVDRPQDIREALASFGYEDVTNRSVLISAGGKTLELHGIDDIWYGKPERFERLSPLVPHLLISHEPDALLNLTEGDTDLVFIGHTHGGQIYFPGLGALWPIPAKLGRRVDRGIRIVNGIRCIISNGLGETDGRMRLWSPPELVVVEVGI